jgi:two-component system, chemotaxis family, sensor kinase CheA
MTLRAGIQTKLFVLISGVAVAITVAFTIGGWRWYSTAATHALEERALTYGRLVGRSVESAIAFDDHETAREAFDAVTVDVDVSAVALFREDGSVLEGRGDYLTVTARSLSAKPSIERTATSISCQALVASREGPRGAIVVVMSRASLERQLASLKMTSTILAVVMMGAGFVVAWWVSRSLARRIKRIAAEAAAVASGVLTRDPVKDDSSDEVGQLASAFNTMVGELRRLVQQIEGNAAEEQERLENLVAARTSELASRNVAMRLLLDNVGEGFMMLDRSGCIGSERSAAVDQWFGAPEAGVTFWKHIAAADPAFAVWFEMSWDALCDGFLPVEVAADQFPKKLESGGRHFDVVVTPIVEDGALGRTLIDIRDVTHQLERERVESVQREVLGLLERALEDRAAYLEFMAEAGSLVDAVAHEKLETVTDVTRAIHTLKGNCGMFGLSSLSTFCHDVESHMEGTGRGSSKADRVELTKRWTSATSRLSNIFSKKTGTLTVDRDDLNGFVDALATGKSRTELLHRARMLRLESVDLRLKRFVEQATRLATRLDKHVDVAVDGGGLRFDAVVWSPFWAAFAHVVRNAVDHGLESPERRQLMGKSTTGSIAIRAALEEDRFVLEVKDDGKGIDWSVLAERARARGLPTATRADLEAALFVDGLSTKKEVSELSGRGVGLGAVRAACTAFGGTISITSQVGSGTTMRFAFPRTALGDAYGESFTNERAVA